MSKGLKEIRDYVYYNLIIKYYLIFIQLPNTYEFGRHDD